MEALIMLSRTVLLCALLPLHAWGDDAKSRPDSLDKQIAKRTQPAKGTTEGEVPDNGRILSGLESTPIAIHTFLGTRWSNLYRDPQAADTFFRPKGFVSLEHEQYFWKSGSPWLFKWSGGATIQGSRASDFKDAGTSADGFGKAVDATDVASAQVGFWFGGFITGTTTGGLFLQHQFNNYKRYSTENQAVAFADTIRSQRRLGLLFQQHDDRWRGSLVEFSLCQDPLFRDSNNRQFLRGRAMYNLEYEPLKSWGFYLEGSINRGKHVSIDRDEAQITLGFRTDLHVWKH